MSAQNSSGDIPMPESASWSAGLKPISERSSPAPLVSKMVFTWMAQAVSSKVKTSQAVKSNRRFMVTLQAKVE